MVKVRGCFCCRCCFSPILWGARLPFAGGQHCPQSLLFSVLDDHIKRRNPSKGDSPSIFPSNLFPFKGPGAALFKAAIPSVWSPHGGASGLCSPSRSDTSCLLTIGQRSRGGVSHPHATRHAHWASMPRALWRRQPSHVGVLHGTVGMGIAECT